MSYILNAIKKTESGEKDGDVPNLSSEHQHTAFIEEDESRRWLRLFLVVIVVLFALVIWLLLESKHNGTNLETESISSEPSKAAVSGERFETNVGTGVDANERLNAAPEEIKSNPDGMNIHSPGVTETVGIMIKKEPLQVQQPVVQKKVNPVVDTVSRPQATEVVASAGTQTEQTTARQPTNSKPVFLAAIDHEHWPTLIYTTHIYATKPEDRFVMLNGKAYSIGDTVMKGMVVEDIMENDLLVNYQGQKVIVPGLTDVNP